MNEDMRDGTATVEDVVAVVPPDQREVVRRFMQEGWDDEPEGDEDAIDYPPAAPVSRPMGLPSLIDDGWWRPFTEGKAQGQGCPLRKGSRSDTSREEIGIAKSLRAMLSVLGEGEAAGDGTIAVKDASGQWHEARPSDIFLLPGVVMMRYDDYSGSLPSNRLVSIPMSSIAAMSVSSPLAGGDAGFAKRFEI